MDSSKHFVKIVYYALAVLVLAYFAIALDDTFFEGKITDLISTVESTIGIQYDDSLFTLETSISCLQADSTHLSMQLKWVI